MVYRILADIVVVLHFGFVLFVVLGGLLVLRWRRLMWLHIPAAVWGVLIEFAGWICPLTPLEQWLRHQGGQSSYTGGFVERYIVSALYPEGLTRTHQIILGLVVLVINLLIYRRVVARSRHNRRREREKG